MAGALPTTLPATPPATLPATVGEHGPDGGWLVLDDGTRLGYAPAAVAPALRLLRSGQRVHVRVAGEPPQVVALALAGMALPA